MPRLPFQISHKAVAKAVADRKAGVTPTVVTADPKPFPNDTTRTYNQLGSALKASEHAQVSAMRVARMIAESKEAEELQEAALAQRLRNLVLEIDDFEKTLLKFKRGKSMRMAGLASNALENLKAAAGWFQRYVGSHTEEDREKLKSLFQAVQAVAGELNEVKKQKVDETVAMEDAFNEKRASAFRKAAVTQSIGKPSELDARRLYPEPAESPVETQADPQALLDAAKLEIVQKEQKSELEKEE